MNPGQRVDSSLDMLVDLRTTNEKFTSIKFKLQSDQFWQSLKSNVVDSYKQVFTMHVLMKPQRFWSNGGYWLRSDQVQAELTVSAQKALVSV